MAIRRPNPLLWVYYSYGGRLPDRYRDWVLHDGTCRTWLLRVFARGFVQVLPVAVVLLAAFLVFGGSWPLAVGAVVLGLLGMLRFVLTYSVESVNGRLTRYGFPPGYGTAMRKQRYRAEHADEARRYRARWRSGAE
ncbi:MAG TPA: DUF5313 family protein [Pseudonocardiaceae bacterium]|jgi:hypothetical protein|nr:DUF5313 family protein [Pseudonocardiaceae bacterium]